MVYATEFNNFCLRRAISISRFQQPDSDVNWHVKMKIKVLNRVEEDFTRERKSDIVKTFLNPDPVLHPFERAREYTRALNAVKLDKVFAKPFVRALSGHRDAVACMARSRVKLTDIISGSCDGELRLWDLCTGNARCIRYANESAIAQFESTVCLL